MDDLLDGLPGGMTPELEQYLQQISEGSAVDDKRRLLQMKMAQAQALRNKAMPEGQMVGGRYIAPNPLQTIGTAIQQGMASRDMRDLMGQDEGLTGQRQGGNMAALKLQLLIDGLRKKKPAETALGPTAGAGDLMPDGDEGSYS